MIRGVYTRGHSNEVWIFAEKGLSLSGVYALIFLTEMWFMGMDRNGFLDLDSYDFLSMDS